MIKALILEDEEYNREFLGQILSEIPAVTEIFGTAIGADAYIWAKENHPDIALVDIELSNQQASGLEVARMMSSLRPEIYVIFVTGYSKYALESIDVHPYGYILKPIKITKLRNLLAEIIDRIKQAKALISNVLTVKVKNEILHINCNDIIFVEVENHISVIHSKDATWEVRKGLDELEGMLGSDFLRVHRSFVVNMTRIKKIKETYDRSYEIEFWDYPRTALMSRYHFPKYKERFRASTERGV